MPSSVRRNFAADDDRQRAVRPSLRARTNFRPSGRGFQSEGNDSESELPHVKRSVPDGRRDEWVAERGTAQDHCEFIKWIKPDKYAPIIPIDSHLSHFETIAQYNEWTAYDKVAHLKASLSGDATQLLWYMGDHCDMSYTDLASTLRVRIK